VTGIVQIAGSKRYGLSKLHFAPQDLPQTHDVESRIAAASGLDRESRACFNRLWQLQVAGLVTASLKSPPESTRRQVTM
jgi:hypothetical protein